MPSWKPSVPQEINLTAMQRSVLRSVFQPFARKIETVSVYGSRAQGRARPGSDIDLVVFGLADEDDIATIRTNLEDSDLSIFADVVAYDGIKHAKLREQIDKWAKPLFTRADLLS
jgi:uncharacterized protein